MSNDEIVNVRYMVDDVEQVDRVLHRAARLRGPDQRRRRRSPMSSGATCVCCSPGRRARPAVRCPMARRPDPGGWNRIHLIVDDIDAEVGRLRDAGATFRNDVVEGPGGKQILLQDPSGNFVELFQPANR